MTTPKVQTVLGPIDAGDLGITQTHEHLLIDMMAYFQMPEEASERAWIDAPVTMDAHWWHVQALYVQQGQHAATG